MPQAYCTECRTHVTVRQGACLAGHPVNTPLHRREPGRHASRTQSGSTLAVALRQVRRSLASPTAISPNKGQHHQPGPERPPTPKVSRRPEDTKRARWSLNTDRLRVPPRPPQPFPSNRSRPASPAHHANNRPGSPLLELFGLAEPPTSLSGPHLPPLGKSAPAEAPAVPPRSDLTMEAPETSPVGPVRPAPSDPPAPPEPLRTSNGALPAPSTSVLVARLLESTIDGTPMEGWKPRPVTGLEERKSRRWPLLVIAAGICMALLTGAKWLVDVPARHADGMRNDLAVAASQLGRSLPRLVGALGPITNPGAGLERLAASSGTLVDLGSASRALSLEANRPLPWAAPFSSTEPTEALRSPRRKAAKLAAGADRIEERLTAALAYRSALRQAFVLPRLPVSASPRDLRPLETRLAEVGTRTGEILGSVPRDAALAEHRRESLRLLDYFERWQVRYLAALRADNPDQTSDLVHALHGKVSKMRSDLADPLRQLDGWAHRRSFDLNQQLQDLARQLRQPST